MKKTVLTFCAVVGLGLGAMAQGSAAWNPQATGFASPSRGIRDIEVPSANAAWVITYDGSGGNANVTDFSRTTNGGTTWTPGNMGSVASGYAFSNISALNKDTAWVAMYNDASGSGGRLLRTFDGGTTWVQQAATTFTNAASFLNIVHMFDANNGWLQGDPANGYFEMYTTSDGGTTWTRVPQANIPAPVAGEFGTVDVYSVIGDTIWFGTNKGRVFRSVDKGLTWTLGGTTGLTTIQDITFASATHGLVRNGADLRRTTDGGLTWSLVQYTGTLYGSDLERVPGTTQTYVSTGAATGASGSSYSLNGGTTWIDFDNGLQRTDVKFFNKTVGYAGGFNTDAVTNGIFKYTGIVDLTSTTASATPATPAVTAAGATTFCAGSSVVLTAASTTPNVTYQWLNNGLGTGVTGATYTATTAGSYTAVAIAGGVSSTPSNAISVTVDPKPATPTITISGNTLSASTATGTYQWYSVSGTTLTPVPGATAQTFTPTVSGTYTVRVTGSNSCQSDAAVSRSVVVGISSLAPGMDVSVYPNPSAGKFMLNLVGFEKEASVQIINVTGQVVANETVSIASDKVSKAFDLGNMAKGVYILKVTSGQNFTFRKLILE